MKRRIFGIAAVVVAGLVAGGVGLAISVTASAHPASPLITSAKTIKFTETHPHINLVDTGPSGSSAGDYIVFLTTLVNDGHRVGHARGLCTQNFPESVYFCDGTFLIKGHGQITIAGKFDFSKPGGTIAVTGGTHDFANARGDADFTFVDAEGDAAWTVHLIP
jgi:hypothetical protein